MNGAPELGTFLEQSQNPDGGWGYFRSKASRLEPTAWGVLALGRAGAAQNGLRLLRRWPADQGLLLEHAGGEPNYGFHGLALLALLAHGVEHAGGNRSLIDGLQRVKGLTTKNTPGSSQDNSLQAWSWIANTFSWVEPTALCLLALKKARPTAGAQIDGTRVDVAERLLVNRSCADGGWNYGNADVLGQDLRPYVPTTSLALLAMQDRLGQPAVARSLAFLESHARSERSAIALGLATIALRVCGRSTDGIRTALLEQIPTTLELGNLASIAVAACALDQTQHGAFTL